MSKLERMLDALTQATALPEIALGLERVQACLARLGHPERKLPPVIHIAGTNGKGSTQAFLRGMCEAAGKRVHAYTSPHLVRFNERIVLAGGEIDDTRLLHALERVKTAAAEMPLTFFEATTLAAFVAFSEVEADILLLEVGLGGRLDATNVVEPLGCIITPVSEDHKEYLGESLAEIAGEKAGIIKPGAVVVVAEQRPEALEAIEKRLRACGVRALIEGRDWTVDREAMPRPSLPGTHQYANAACAAVVAREILRLPAAAIEAGIRQARWPARLQRLTRGPLVDRLQAGQALWLDGGHNPAAGAMLRQWAADTGAKVGLIVGMLRRKDARGFFKPFAGEGISIATIGMESGFSAQELAAQAGEVSDLQAFGGIEDALEWLQERECAHILVCGSLYLAGKLLKDHS